MKNTSWEDSSQWYDSIVGKEGHYYHKNIILPELKKHFPLKKGDKVLDVGCGQGIFAKTLSKDVKYVGIDLATSLINEAKKQAQPGQQFFVKDATKPLNLDQDFSHAIAILSLQNMKEPQNAIKNISDHLKPGGKAVLILNHPCFRIPRQSSWGLDEPKKLQYRRLDRYMSPLEVPITTHPGRKNSQTTYSYHHPLSWWFQNLHGMVVTNFLEWTSNKVSSGKMAKAENRAREEFPLFCTLLLSK